MKYLVGLLFLFFLVQTYLNAQHLLPVGARSIAMGGTGLAYDDANAIFSNQAGLAHFDNWGAILIAESRFARSPINSFAAGAAVNTKLGAFGLALHRYGIDIFNEQKIGLAYARKLTDGLSLGAQFDFISANIPNYGSKGAITFEAGLQASITKELVLGVHVFSPSTIQLAEDYIIPTVYSAGIAYIPSSKTSITLEIEKDIDFPLRVRTGVEYRFLDALYLRIGAATAPTLVTFGIGIQIPSGIAIDVASTYHQILGITPSISIRYTSKQVD